MKQVYDCQQLIAIGSQFEFKHTSAFDHLHLFDAKQALNAVNRTHYKNFKDFFEACAEDKIRNAETYSGLFKVPKVKVWCGSEQYIITAHNFPDEIRVWNRIRNVSYYSMKKLMEKLPADEFAEYLRERNISLCINN